jgi:hypothetical protein
MSPQFWLFWVFSVPLTAAAALCGLAYYQSQRRGSRLVTAAAAAAAGRGRKMGSWLKRV